MPKLPKLKQDRGYYMRVFRAMYNMNQAEAAEFFGVGASHWSLMEDGKRGASPKVAKRLSDTIHAPIELFLDLTEKSQ